MDSPLSDIHYRESEDEFKKRKGLDDREEYSDLQEDLDMEDYYEKKYPEEV